MPAHFEKGEKCDGSKFELAFTQCWNNLKMVGNLMVKTSLQDFDVKEVYLHPKNRSVSFQCSVFIIFNYLHDAVFKMCRLEFRVQNLPFSKSTAKKFAVFV